MGGGKGGHLGEKVPSSNQDDLGELFAESGQKWQKGWEFPPGMKTKKRGEITLQ